jgi:hypothetical protein
MTYELPNYDEVLYMLEDMTRAVEDYDRCNTPEEQREAMKVLMEVYKEAVEILPKD